MVENSNLRRENMFWTNIVTGIGIGFCLGWIIKGHNWKLWRFRDVADNVKVILKNKRDHKMVFVVRNDLKMGKGKIAAQCSHAAIKSYKTILKCDEKTRSEWESSGQPKVVLKVEDEKSLREIDDKARSLGLVTAIIRDAGHTQVPSGSVTVLGVGPGPIELVDQVTGHLKLL